MLLIVGVAVGCDLSARPPVDLIFPSDTFIVKPKRKIRDGDLVYTGINTLSPAEKLDKFILDNPGRVYRVRSSVLGRKLPTRSSKAISRLPAGEYVKEIKPSRSQRWLLVEKYSNKKKSWIPKAPLEKVED